MSAWDLDRLRKAAGLPLTEGKKKDDKKPDDDGDGVPDWADKKPGADDKKKDGKKAVAEAFGRDDDDDEDPDVKIAMGDKRQREFEGKNKKHLDDNAEMMKKRTAEQRAAAAKKKEEAKKEAPKAEEKKPEEKKADKPAAKAAPKAEEKKEAPKAEEKKDDTPAAKKRGRAANPDSFNQHAKANAKSMTRGEFIKWAAEKHNKGKNYASSLFAKYNPKSQRELKEAKVGWILVHPHMPTFTLAENYEMKSMQWIDSSSDLNTIVHLSEAEAQKTAKYMSEWRGQSSVIEKVEFDD